MKNQVYLLMKDASNSYKINNDNISIIIDNDIEDYYKKTQEVVDVYVKEHDDMTFEEKKKRYFEKVLKIREGNNIIENYI